jgi:hypothetical protein
VSTSCASPFAGTLYLEVLPRSEEARQFVPVELDGDGKARLDFVLATGAVVAGRVSEAGTGRALEGAIVGEGRQSRRTAVTDTEGLYRLEGVGGAGAYGLTARAAGHAGAKRLTLPPTVDGVVRVDFELGLSASVAGRVVDDAGAPLKGARVVASGGSQGPEGRYLERSATTTDADGCFRLEDLSPGVRSVLSCRPRASRRRARSWSGWRRGGSS